MKIRTRAYLLGILPALLVAVLLSSYLGLNRIRDLEAALVERGGALTRHVAQGAEYAVVSGNLDSLRQQLDWAAQERGVIYVAAYRPSGVLIAEAGQKEDALRVPLKTGMVNLGVNIVFTVPVDLASLALEDPFFQAGDLNAIQPPPPSAFQASTQRIAWVQTVISRATNTSIARQQFFSTLGLVGLAMLFAAMLVRGLVLGGIRPLMEIIGAVRDITAHNFRVRLSPTAKSELRELQMGINQMSQALQSFQDDMQRRVDGATAELANQKEAAERANQAKSRFLAAASHDLRQPMHAISLYVESMKPEVTGRKSAATLVKIETAVAAMESLFCGILDISRLDAGAVVPEVATLSVKNLVDSLYNDFSNSADAKGLQLRLHYCDALIASDAVLLRRILSNLVSNAIRYTDHGGVLIAARKWRGGIRFQVWDTGQGIQPEHLENIFHEYFQAANPQRDRAQGLGLGLAIVDRLADLLRHPLALHTRPGRGTVFSLDVPIGQDAPTPANHASSALEDMTQLRGMVAIVDDDAMVLDSLKTLLSGWGLNVVMAASASDLLEQLAQAPDLLITDYRLGAEDGLTLAKLLQDAYPGTPFPTILMTGDVSEESVRSLSSSEYQVLHKPVRPARLRALITHLLSRK